MENNIWFDPSKDADEGEIRKTTIEKADELFKNLSDLRSDAFRYFLMVDYKHYKPDSDSIFQKDDNEEHTLLQNPHLTLNVTNSCIETLNNKIAKVKPRVTFLTKNAEREKRELARKLDKWMLKVFKKSEAWKKSAEAFKSACVCGLGVIKTMPTKEGKVDFSKVPVFSFFCDNAHTGPTEPETAGEIKSFSLYDLIAMFPSKEKELKEAYSEKMDKRIKVFEIFKKYKKHAIMTKEVTLLYEKWDKPLPYTLFHTEKSDQGVIGVGIAKKLYAIQSAISYILGKTFMSIRNFAVPRVFLPKNASPTHKDMTNVVGEIIEINTDAGQKLPEFSTPPAINQQVISILEMLWQRAFEVVGISSLSAGGQVPRGLNQASGQALRTYQAVESERFQLIRADYENNFIKMAKKVIKMSPDSAFPKGVKRGDIMEAKDDLNIWTSSLLPDTPAGKLAFVGDLFNTGLLNPNQALSLMDSPDTDKFINSETSRMRAIDLLLDRALDKGKKPRYYPSLGLDMYLDRARKLLAQTIIEDEDSPKITLLESCIEELTDKVSQQTKIKDTLQQVTGGPIQPQQGGQPEPINIGERAEQVY